MSPHAIADSECSSAAVDGSFWKHFGITKHGFLPSKAPLRRLPGEYYLPWELLMQELPSLLQDGTLRYHVDQLLPTLSLEGLQSEGQLRRAYVVLCFLAHAYIWGGERASERLPPQLAVPLLQVSTRLELPPVATYAALNLWNFTSTGTSFDDLDSLVAIHTFTGTESESWFYMVSVAMECHGARAIPLMVRALEGVKTRDFKAIASCLRELSYGIYKIGLLLDRMHERCDPLIFYHEIRPFLAGSKNMAAAGLPDGVFYDEGNGKGQWMQFRGGSNGQSSLIQFLDIVLGVDHTSAGNSTPDGKLADAPVQTEPPISFHEEVRGYMPGPHRKFLDRVSQMGSIRNLALSPGTAPEQLELRDAFQAAVKALANFRNKHLAIVTRYIVIPSRTPYRGRKENLASSSCREGTRDTDSNVELTGTGGTALLPFLKQSRNETLLAGFNPSDQ